MDTNNNNTRCLHVLLVEDSPLDIKLIQTIASKADAEYEITSARTLTAAREALASERYDAVMLDMHFPDGDGMDLLQEIVEQQPTLPVFVLTGVDDELMSMQALKAGAYDFMRKDLANYRQVLANIPSAVQRNRRLSR